MCVGCVMCGVVCEGDVCVWWDEVVWMCVWVLFEVWCDVSECMNV